MIVVVERDNLKQKKVQPMILFVEREQRKQKKAQSIKFT